MLRSASPPIAHSGRARLVLLRVLLLALALTLPLAGFELALRARPQFVGPDFATAVLSKYHARPGGIYYRDPALKMNFMIPSFETDMYSNGYTWHHRTDALGFRNEPGPAVTDVILLGDSFVYGHGVELDQTIGANLAQLSGLRVFNLGQQGNSAFQEAYVTSEYVPRLRPRYVVYFFFNNDLADLSYYLSDREMRRFAERDLTQITYPPRTDPTTALAQRKTPDDPLLEQLFITRAVRFFSSDQASRVQRGANYGETDEQSPEWLYTKQAIRFMRYVSERDGARFVMAPITFMNHAHLDILRRFARELDIPLVDTSEGDDDPSRYLAGDGHFSGMGARSMAAAVSRFLTVQADTRSPRS